MRTFCRSKRAVYDAIVLLFFKKQANKEKSEARNKNFGFKKRSGSLFFFEHRWPSG